MLAALVHPFFLALVVTDAAFGNLFEPSDSVGEALRQGVAVTTLMSGYLGSAALALVGLARRQLLGSASVLLFMPVWIMLSFAAWRGAIQLAISPHLWEKTEHGLARTSRYNKTLTKKPPLSATARRVKAAFANRPLPRPRFAAD